MSFDVSQIFLRFRNEVHICNLLHHEDVGVIPFVGVYSTEVHPRLCLVYERMNLDLRQHLRSEQNVGGLELLRYCSKFEALARLRYCPRRFRDNELVDKCGTPHVAGLGNARALPYPAEGSRSNQLSLSHSPEMANTRPSSGVTSLTASAKIGDIYDFAVMAYEVLTGCPPFSELTEIAVMCSMLKGDGPPRPNNQEISNRVWYMVEQCWTPSPRSACRSGRSLPSLKQNYNTHPIPESYDES